MARQNFVFETSKESLKGKSGIYSIVNLQNDNKYVGSSINIYNRMWCHQHALYTNTHHSPYLQRSVNQYGIENFLVKIIEFCPIDSLEDKEFYWVKELKPEYNICGVNTERILNFTPQMKYKRSLGVLHKNGFSKVKMLNINDSILNEFDSLYTAAGFIKYNGLSKANLQHISGKISDIARGNKVHHGIKRDYISNTAYGYKWKYE